MSVCLCVCVCVCLSCERCYLLLPAQSLSVAPGEVQSAAHSMPPSQLMIAINKKEAMSRWKNKRRLAHIETGFQIGKKKKDKLERMIIPGGVPFMTCVLQETIKWKGRKVMYRWMGLRGGEG